MFKFFKRLFYSDANAICTIDNNTISLDIDWENCKRAFYIDGSWRDIYVLNANIQTWELFLEFVKDRTHGLKYLYDGDVRNVPTNAKGIFNDTEHLHTLSIKLDGMTIVAHFFCVDEIELDIDPKEVLSEIQFNSLMKFIKALGLKLSLDVIVTPENEPDAVLFRYIAADEKLLFDSKYC